MNVILSVLDTQSFNKEYSAMEKNERSYISTPLGQEKILNSVVNILTGLRAGKIHGSDPSRDKRLPSSL